MTPCLTPVNANTAHCILLTPHVPFNASQLVGFKYYLLKSNRCAMLVVGRIFAPFRCWGEVPWALWGAVVLPAVLSTVPAAYKREGAKSRDKIAMDIFPCKGWPHITIMTGNQSQGSIFPTQMITPPITPPISSILCIRTIN